MAKKSSLRLLLKAACVLVAASTALACAAAWRAYRQMPLLHFFDVGQGDAVLLQRGRLQTLIDGGPDASILAKLGAAMPFGDRVIECMILTHPHLDHFGGLTQVLARYRVAVLAVSGPESGSADYRAFAEAAGQSGARIVRIARGDELACDPEFRFDVLSPPRLLPAGTPENEFNESSVVLRLRRSQAPKDERALALLTGDAGFVAEKEMAAARQPLAAHLLKVGHHGSATASSEAFLAAVSPDVAVIQVGAKNRYRHPSPAALERLGARGIAVLRTDQDGDARFALRSGVPERISSAFEALLLLLPSRHF